MAAGHMSDNALRNIQSSDIIFQSGWTFPLELQAHTFYILGHFLYGCTTAPGTFCSAK